MFEVLFNMWPDVFVDAGDKAKLITIVISSGVAVCILLLNQWFINRRERKQMHREKIEALYIAVSNYQNAAELVVEIRRLQYKKKDINEGSSEEIKRSEAWTKAYQEVDMLIGLYFKHVNFDKTRFFDDMQVGYEDDLHAVGTKGYLESQYQYSSIQINKTCLELFEICESLMIKHTRTKLERIVGYLKSMCKC